MKDHGFDKTKNSTSKLLIHFERFAHGVNLRSVFFVQCRIIVEVLSAQKLKAIHFKIFTLELKCILYFFLTL